jgi:hypothetical protein
VAQAKLKDGMEVDLLRKGAPIDWKRPDFPAGLFPNDRWRKVFREMAYNDQLGYQVFRAPVASFLCRAWNARAAAQRQITAFDLVYCMENKAEKPETIGVLVFRECLLHFDLSDW